MIRFFLRFLAQPSMVGAIAPASSLLATAMVRQINGGTQILEIGAGTGAITRLIPVVAPAANYVVFEQDRHLARHLRNKLGHERVIEGLFDEMVDGLGNLPDSLVILSSVPFKTLAKTIHARTVNAICKILLASPERRLIQYSYFDRLPFDPPHHRLRWRRLTRVWANIPPATVWELRAAPSDMIGS